MPAQTESRRPQWASEHATHCPLRRTFPSSSPTCNIHGLRHHDQAFTLASFRSFSQHQVSSLTHVLPATDRRGMRMHSSSMAT